MLDNIWYSRKKSLVSVLLFPISLIFSLIAKYRKSKFSKTAYKSKFPILIVGNISVGGTGKTPVVRKLALDYLKKGYKPAIISRGYGAKADKYPLLVNGSTLASECGDEPAMLYSALGDEVPIVVGPQRIESVKYIEDNFKGVDVIISDDGLQHYHLARSFEIVVVDASRMFGNKLCLPAGPLREPLSRLQEVDLVLAVGNCSDTDRAMLDQLGLDVMYTNVKATKLVNISNGVEADLDLFAEVPFTAVAGIGNPDKFFKTLNENQLIINKSKLYKDHYKYKESDFDDVPGDEMVIMTFKDAVKCKSFAKDNWWYLDIDLDTSFASLESIYRLQLIANNR